MFGFFKEKLADTKTLTGELELPVIIPPAKDRSAIPTDSTTTVFNQVDIKPISSNALVAGKDVESSCGVFNSPNKLSELKIHNFVDESPGLKEEQSLTSQILCPNPSSSISEQTPSTSNLARFNNKKIASNKTLASELQDYGIEKINVPLSLIIKSIPPEMLSISPDKAQTSSEIASSIIRLPMSEILSQIPSGKIELPLHCIFDIVPKHFFKKDINAETKVRIPLNEIVNLIPSDKPVGLFLNTQQKEETYKFLNPVTTPFSNTIREDKSEVHPLFEFVSVKASPSGGSSTSAQHPPEAPHIGLGFLKPKPSHGEISDKILASQSAQKEHFQDTKLLAQAPLKLSLQKHTDSQYLKYPSTALHQQVPFPLISGEEVRPSTITPAAAVLPKITPLPTEAQLSQITNPSPVISLAPTGKSKPPAIGGASRIGQSSAACSRENLATLAKLAAQTNQGLSLGQTRQEDAKNRSFFNTLTKQEKNPHLETKRSTHESFQQKPFGNLSELASPEEDSTPGQITDKFSLPLKPVPQNEVHTLKKTVEPVFSKKITVTTGTPKTPLSVLEKLTNDSSTKQYSNNAQNPSDEPKLIKKNVISTQQMPSNDFYQKNEIPFQTGLITPLNKPTLFRYTENPVTKEASKLHDNNFPLRHLETGVTNQSIKNTQDTSQNTYHNPPTNERKDDPVESQITKPLTSDDGQNIVGPSKQPAPTTREVHTPFSSSTPFAPIHERLSVLHTGSARSFLGITFSLARWLGLESDSPVAIESIPVLLTNNPYIKGAAVIDAEGLTLSAHLPHGLSENAIGALTLRLYQQAKTAAKEMGSAFEGQCVVSLGRWTLQITHAPPFYLATFHDGLDFPPALARRLRKVAAALVRQEQSS